MSGLGVKLIPTTVIPQGIVRTDPEFMSGAENGPGAARPCGRIRFLTLRTNPLGFRGE